MLLLVGPSPERSGGIATWMRLVRDELANRAVAFPFALFATDKDHGGLGPLPQRLLDGAAVVRRFRATLRATRPRVVHLCCGSGWGLKEASVLTVLAKNAGAFVVIHLHAASLFERMDDSAVERPLSLAALRRADAVAVLGSDVAAGLRERGFKGRAHVVPNGVVLGPVAPAPPRPPLRLVLLGSVEDRKGLAVLTAALERLGPRDDLAIQWLGPLRAPQPSVRRAEAAGIEFKGSVPPRDVANSLARSHALLLPSLREGLPFAVLEAMAAGRAIIASDVGVLRDVLGKGGWLLPPGDATALCAAIERALDEPEWVLLAGAAARREVEERGRISGTVDCLLDLWRPGLESRP